jgi:hypothetical protein
LGKKTESRGRMLLADSFVDLILSGILVSKKGKVKKKKKTILLLLPVCWTMLIFIPANFMA